MDSYTQFVLRSCAKTPRTQSEAFKDADYANPIQMPEKADNDYIGVIVVCLIVMGFIAALIIHF